MNDNVVLTCFFAFYYLIRNLLLLYKSIDLRLWVSTIIFMTIASKNGCSSLNDKVTANCLIHGLNVGHRDLLSQILTMPVMCFAITSHHKPIFATLFPLLTTDDEQMGLSSVPQNLGMIRLMLYHVYKYGKPKLSDRNIFDLKAVSSMSEKSKSIGFHSVS